MSCSDTTWEDLLINLREGNLKRVFFLRGNFFLEIRDSMSQ